MDYSLIWYLIIGFLLGNGMPHFIFGRAKIIARSPFGQRSKPRVNLLWGLANFVVATLLSLWQITEKTLTGASLLALLVGFWLAVLMFGVAIKRFLND